MPLNEADTCRVYVTPKLKEAGWDASPRSINCVFQAIVDGVSG
jgi:type I site-specific restriction endonuclease